MVARIAPSPISTSVAAGDAGSHAVLPDSVVASLTNQGKQPFALERGETARVNTPPPPAVPGEAFAAAIIAGQLPPRPMTPEQLRQRLGAAWQPPASSLRLMDRSA
jgi:hypothetical protein